MALHRRYRCHEMNPPALKELLERSGEMLQELMKEQKRQEEEQQRQEEVRQANPPPPAKRTRSEKRQGPPLPATLAPIVNPGELSINRIDQIRSFLREQYGCQPPVKIHLLPIPQPGPDGAEGPLAALLEKRGRHSPYGSKAMSRFPYKIGKCRALLFAFLASLLGWWIEVAIYALDAAGLPVWEIGVDGLPISTSGEPVTKETQSIYLGNLGSAGEKERGLLVRFPVTGETHSVCLNIGNVKIKQRHRLIVTLVGPENQRTEIVHEMIALGHKFETGKKQMAIREKTKVHQCIDLLTGAPCERTFTI